MRILITSAGSAAAEYLVRYWVNRGHRVHIADVNRDACPTSVAAQQRHALPRGDDLVYDSALFTLCLREKIDIVVPCADEELHAASRLPDIAVLCPSFVHVTAFLDKATTARVLGAAHLPVARSRSTDFGVIDAGEHPVFPLIIKPRRSRGSRGVQRVDTVEEMRAYLTLSRLPASEIVAQEMLVGQEYTVTCVSTRDGVLRAVVPVRVLDKRGITLHGVIDANHIVIKTCEEIHAVFPMRGVCNMQGMLTLDHRFVIFEINPRPSTTLVLALAAGIDPIAAWYDTRGPSTLLTFENGLRLRRRWTNEITTS